MRRIAIVALACVAVDGARFLVVPQAGASVQEERLEGRWEVVSLERSGWPDAAQVGAFLTFADGRVIAEPKAIQNINDGTG